MVGPVKKFEIILKNRSWQRAKGGLPGGGTILQQPMAKAQPGPENQGAVPVPLKVENGLLFRDENRRGQRWGPGWGQKFNLGQNLSCLA